MPSLKSLPKNMMERLIGTKLKPSEFALLAFGWTPFDYQIGPLDSETKRIVVVFGRQSGKTELTALKGLYHALWNDGSTILVISKTLRQSQILFRRMKNFLNLSAQLKPELNLAGMITRETQLTVEFCNGSAIHSLPATEDGGNLRGFTANMIIVDESAEVKDEVFTAISPMLATTNGVLMLTGTPKGIHNFFYEAASNEKYNFEAYHFESKDCPLITADFLEAERIRMGDFAYQQEYEAKFLEEADSYFPVDLVDRCIDLDCPVRDMPLPNYDYYLGIDPAREGRDETALCFLERRQDAIYAVKFLGYHKKDIAWIANLAMELHQNWKFRMIIVDETGVGAGLVDILKARHFPVQGLRFTQKSKEEAFSHLKALMMQEMLVLPQLKQLRNQLLDMRFEPRETFIRIFTTSEKLFHDDLVAALVLAAWGVKERKVTPLWSRPVRGMFG